MKKYEVESFSDIDLNNLLEDCEDIRKLYFVEYLKKINCETILIEFNYIDKDYLKDYTDYYSRCFVDYNKDVNVYIFSQQNLLKMNSKKT